MPALVGSLVPAPEVVPEEVVPPAGSSIFISLLGHCSDVLITNLQYPLCLSFCLADCDGTVGMVFFRVVLGITGAGSSVNVL